MRAPDARRWARRLGLAALATTAGCRSDDAALPPPDPALVETLAEVHLADARAEATGAPRDSLRRVALAAHGTDAAALARALDRLARDPAAATATWAAVAARLDGERLGTADSAGTDTHTNEHPAEAP